MSNDTATITLTAFLLARIAEDEEVARDAGIATGDRGYGDERLASGREWTTRYHEVMRRRVLADQDKRIVADAGGFIGLSVAPHIARHDPARVLADCEAKRRIVGLRPVEVLSENPQAWRIKDRVLRLLALPYADHLDYRKEWRV